MGFGDYGYEKLAGIPRAGDPNGDIVTLWRAKVEVRDFCTHSDPDVALDRVTELGRELKNTDYPVEAPSLGRTLIRWSHQIAARPWPTRVTGRPRRATT